MQDDHDNQRCPHTLDWVRQACDAESGVQLSLFDRLYVPIQPEQPENIVELRSEAIAHEAELLED